MSMTGDDRIHVTPTSAQKAFEQAAELHGDSQLAEAERLYDIALSLDPDHPGALCYLGLLRLQQDGPREAADLLRRATECDPGSPEAHNHLGTALQRLGNHVQALECHDRALTLLPEYSEARANRGRALQALGRVSESIPCYEAALADLPDSAPIQLALASALDSLDRTEAAFVHYRNAAALDPALAAPLSQALTAYSGRHPAAAQQGMQRLNQYIHSFLTNQGNARMGIYPGLSSTPFHDASRLPGAVALMQNHEAIAAEIEALAGAEFQPEAEFLMDR
jgi:tetratricopeptide (TPR) repeat protein